MNVLQGYCWGRHRNIPYVASDAVDTGLLQYSLEPGRNLSNGFQINVCCRSRAGDILGGRMLDVYGEAVRFELELVARAVFVGRLATYVRLDFPVS